MINNNDYTTLPLPQLLLEEKKLKKQEFISAIISGVAIGIIVYSIAKNGLHFVSVMIPVILLVINYKSAQSNKQNLKKVQAEIIAKSIQ